MGVQCFHVRDFRRRAIPMMIRIRPVDATADPHRGSQATTLIDRSNYDASMKAQSYLDVLRSVSCRTCIEQFIRTPSSRLYRGYHAHRIREAPGSRRAIVG